MSKRIAHNAISCRWQGIDFSSLNALDDHLGKTHGYARSYWAKNMDLLGYKIVTEIAPPKYESKTTRRVNRKWPSSKMIEFAAYCMSRKKEVEEFKLKGMLEKFKVLNGIKNYEKHDIKFE